MRKFDLPDSFIALVRREQVMAVGMVVPLVMWCSIISLYSEPGALRSDRNRSPGSTKLSEKRQQEKSFDFTCRQVNVSVFVDDILALRSLARPRGPQDKDNIRLVRGHAYFLLKYFWGEVWGWG